LLLSCAGRSLVGVDADLCLPGLFGPFFLISSLAPGPFVSHCLFPASFRLLLCSSWLGICLGFYGVIDLGRKRTLRLFSS